MTIDRDGRFWRRLYRRSGHPKLERTRGGCSPRARGGEGGLHDVNFNLIKA